MPQILYTSGLFWQFQTFTQLKGKVKLNAVVLSIFLCLSSSMKLSPEPGKVQSQRPSERSAHRGPAELHPPRPYTKPYTVIEAGPWGQRSDNYMVWPWHANDCLLGGCLELIGEFISCPEPCATHLSLAISWIHVGMAETLLYLQVSTSTLHNTKKKIRWGSQIIFLGIILLSVKNVVSQFCRKVVSCKKRSL